MLNSQNLLAWVTAIAWATWALWLVGAFWTWREMWRAKEIAPLAGDELKERDAPLVSILVPARNEAERVLAAAISSMLTQDYPAFEVIAVNDRSTDATGEILRAIEQRSSRLRVLEGADPPNGWFGKPYALQQALQAARGKWMLATDADMIFAPMALRTAMREALLKNYEALTLLPRVDCLSFWERVFLPVFGWFMLLAAPLARVNDPRCRAALGVGGFFLIRRDVLERIGGYAAVRAEVAEDLRLAELLKKSGARLRVDFAPQLIRTRMQTNLRELWEGFSKNLFAGAKFSITRAMAGATSILIFAVAPAFVVVACLMLSLTSGSETAACLILPCLLVWLTQAATFAFIDHRWNIPARYALIVPLGHALFVAILLNSAARIVAGRGVTWKGRKLYATASDMRARTEANSKS